MLDFHINNSNFLILFGSYIIFIASVFGVSNAISVIKEKKI